MREVAPELAKLYDHRKEDDYSTIDSKIMANEYPGMVRDAEIGGQPQTGPREGMDAPAPACALTESGISDSPFTVEDVVEGRSSQFQDVIDGEIGFRRASIWSQCATVYFDNACNVDAAG